MAVAKKRMFWNADKTKLVDEDSPEAASLAAAVGDEIPEVEASEKKAGVAVNKAVKAADNK